MNVVVWVGGSGSSFHEAVVGQVGFKLAKIEQSNDADTKSKVRTNSAETPQRKSHANPRTAWRLKGISGSLSSSPAGKTPRNRSPEVIERKKRASPVSEKKCPTIVSELESQLAQLHEDLKKVKDQLNASESFKKRAHEEAEEAKNQLSTMSARFEDSQQQLQDLSACEDARVRELRKNFQDRDRALQSELEAVKKQHSMDSAALTSAMNEIQRLKVAETKFVESTGAEDECADCKESKAQALETVEKIKMQLETTNATAEMLQTDGMKNSEAYNSFAIELQQSNARVKSMEGLVNKLQEDLDSQKPGDDELAIENEESKEMEKLKGELNFAKLEIAQLKLALDTSELRYQEEYVRTTMQIRSAYEQVELTMSESCKREVELEKAKAQIEELNATLMDKETELQAISNENEGLSRKIEDILRNEHVEVTKSESCNIEVELEKAKAQIEELKATLMDKVTELQAISEENEGLDRKIENNIMSIDTEYEQHEEMKNQENLLVDKEREVFTVAEKNEELKREIQNQIIEKVKSNDYVIASAEVGNSVEQEALIKLEHVTEEADIGTKRVALAHMMEQLNAAQSANTDLEAELRKVKVQVNQWRKAAEAATAILSTDNNYGKYNVDRRNSQDKILFGHLVSPFSDDMDDELSPKKRNGNVLKKFGMLWKKGQE
ncbi:hypothetical protein ACFE04_001761 [Oxalis oulophora]